MNKTRIESQVVFASHRLSRIIDTVKLWKQNLKNQVFQSLWITADIDL